VGGIGYWLLVMGNGGWVIGNWLWVIGGRREVEALGKFEFLDEGDSKVGDVGFVVETESK